MRHDLIVTETGACCEQVQETLGEKPNGTAFAITLHAAPTLDATNLVVGKASLCLPRCLVVNAGNPRRAFWPCSFGGFIPSVQVSALVVFTAFRVKVVDGMETVKTLAALPAVKDNANSGYVKCACACGFCCSASLLTVVLSSVCCPNQRVHH